MNIKSILHYQDKRNLHFSEHLNYYFFHLKSGRTTCHLLVLSKDDFASMFRSLLAQPWDCQSRQVKQTIKEFWLIMPFNDKTAIIKQYKHNYFTKYIGKSKQIDKALQ